MAEKTHISWCDSTKNIWYGCVEHSPGCANCYAKVLTAKFGLSGWGKDATRVPAKDQDFNELYKWNKQSFYECLGCGWRGTLRFGNDVDGCPGCKSNPYTVNMKPATRRVFVGSLMDIFEDNPQLEQNRRNFLYAAEKCANIEFLLLTKRPENIEKMVPQRWLGKLEWPINVRVGATIESQKFVWRAHVLLDLNIGTGAQNFVSVEPMLGPVKFGELMLGIDWVICGAESGKNRRPFDPKWAVDLHEECERRKVPFFMKQGSAFRPGQKGELPDWLFGIKEFPNDTE